MKNGCAGGYIISSHPSGMIMCTTNVQNEQGIEEEISYLGTTLFGQKKQKLAKSGIHPNFGLVNEGVRPLLFTKLRISLNRDGIIINN